MCICVCIGVDIAMRGFVRLSLGMEYGISHDKTIDSSLPFIYKYNYKLPHSCKFVFVFVFVWLDGCLCMVVWFYV